MVKAAERCEPLMRLLQRELISGPLVNSDETPVQVLDESGRVNTTNSYLWVFRGGTQGKEAVLYRYSPTRPGDVPREMLQGFRGYLQTDAFSAYDGLDKQVRLVGCFAHVRRNFVKVIHARGKGAKKTGSAEVALEYIRKLYALEKAGRQQGLSPPEFFGHSLCVVLRIFIIFFEKASPYFGPWVMLQKCGIHMRYVPLSHIAPA